MILAPPEYEELLAWYLDVFGLELRPRGRIQTTTNVPGMNLSFGNSDEALAPTRRRAIDHIGFEIDTLQLKIAYLTDPSGVRIELTEGYDSY